MLTIAIDPGKDHTGVVVMRRENLEWVTDTHFTGPAEKVIDTLRLLVGSEVVTAVVLEKPPTVGIGLDVPTLMAWAVIHHELRKWRPELRIDSVLPGQWKPFTKKQLEVKAPWKQTDQHQADAYRMWWWWCHISMGEFK